MRYACKIPNGQNPAAIWLTSSGISSLLGVSDLPAIPPAVMLHGICHSYWFIVEEDFK